MEHDKPELFESWRQPTSKVSPEFELRTLMANLKQQTEEGFAIWTETNLRLEETIKEQAEEIERLKKLEVVARGLQNNIYSRVDRLESQANQELSKRMEDLEKLVKWQFALIMATTPDHVSRDAIQLKATKIVKNQNGWAIYREQTIKKMGELNQEGK